MDKRFILSEVGVKHSLSDGSLDLFFVVTYDSAVAFLNYLYHRWFRVLRGFSGFQRSPKTTAKVYEKLCFSKIFKEFCRIKFTFWETICVDKIFIILIYNDIIKLLGNFA